MGVTYLELLNILVKNKKLSAEYILNSKYHFKTPSERGFGYEAICILVMPFILDFDEMSNTHISLFPDMIPIRNYFEFINKPIQQGDNKSDITIKQLTTYIGFSVKYKEDQGNKGTDVEDIESYMKDNGVNYQVGLIVKDKSELLNHKYKHT
jgi:hypothetical protein